MYPCTVHFYISGTEMAGDPFSITRSVYHRNKSFDLQTYQPRLIFSLIRRRSRTNPSGNGMGWNRIVYSLFFVCGPIINEEELDEDVVEDGRKQLWYEV